MAPIGPNAKGKKGSRSWEAIGLPEWCLDAVGSMGFTKPTPAQAAAIPLFLANSDVVVETPTGSGKSLSFLIPLAVRILRRFGATEDSAATPIKRGHVAAVVLAPTRELADQLHRVFLDLVAFHPATAAILPYVQRPARALQQMQQRGKKAQRRQAAAAATAAADGQDIIGEDADADDPEAAITPTSRRPETTEPVIVPQLIVGGTKSTPAADVSTFVRQGTNVLIGTPGRMAEFLASRAVNSTTSFEALVLDEADRLLDLGFSNELQRILAFIPKQRRTFLCSASVNDAVGELINVNLRNPKRIVVRVKAVKKDADGVDAASSLSKQDTISEFEKKTPASLLNTYLVLPSSQKLPALIQILTNIEPRPLRTIVFLGTCFSVKYYAAVLSAAMPAGYTVLSLHGKMYASSRDKSYEKFLSTTSPCVLFTTDVASRGLDVPNADLVINIDPPTDPKTFLHRCGRTGRAGRRGLAVTMLRPGTEAETYVPYLDARKTPVEPLETAVASMSEVSALSEQTARELTDAMRRQVCEDRELHELSLRAFVSWVQNFQKHQAKSIFRVSDLDWDDLGHAWGLARLPKMPELRKAGITDRSLGLGDTVDVDAIPYKDKAKEKARLEEKRAAEEAAAAGEDGNGKDNKKTRKRNAPWSGKQDQDAVRTERRGKRQRRREAERLAQMTPEERANKAKVDAMVEEVRQQNLRERAKASKSAGGEDDDDDDFGGFSD